jgi:hypothetical protein
MKTIILATITTILLTTTVQASTTCNMSLYTKKAGAKTMYTIKGDRFSKKNVVKLSKICDVKVELMSASLLKSIKIASLRAKLNKALGNK